MADLLPSSPDPSAGDGGEPRVIGVDSEDADDLLGALQSETARDVLGVLYDDPAAPSDLAEEVDTSIQNVRYHLEKLADAELVTVADTVYSEKGREMKVYAPSAKPLVVFAGNDDETPGIEAALSRLLGGLGILGASSLAVQHLFGGSGGGSSDTDTVFQGDDSGGVNASGTTTESVEVKYDSGSVQTVEEEAAETTRTAAETTQTVTEETSATITVEATTTVAEETTQTITEGTAQSTTTVTEAAGSAMGGVPPGVLFFAGGLVVLLALGAAWYLRTR
jgi:DNA-binding transcriptional ArsR family regulator